MKQGKRLFTTQKNNIVARNIVAPGILTGALDKSGIDAGKPVFRGLIPVDGEVADLTIFVDAPEDMPPVELTARVFGGSAGLSATVMVKSGKNVLDTILPIAAGSRVELTAKWPETVTEVWFGGVFHVLRRVCKEFVERENA